jgi:hypothetical protein
MKLTEDFIPLPYGECLLTDSSLRNVSPVVYKDGGSLRNAIKVSFTHLAVVLRPFKTLSKLL